MFCKKCGAKIDKNDLFCNKCGERVVGEVVKRKRCKQCGWEMDNNISFCNNCGSRMLEEVIASDSSIEAKKVESKNKSPKMTKKNIIIFIILVLVVGFVINIRNRNTLSGTYYEYDEETSQFYNDRMVLDFSRDGTVVIRDGDRVYQGNYRKENNLVYVSSPGVSGEPLQMRSKNELIYENYHNVQVFKKQNAGTTVQNNRTERKSVLNDGNTYLTYLSTYPCEYLPNLDGIYYGMPLDKAAEYLEEEGFMMEEDAFDTEEESQVQIREYSDLISVSNAKWSGELQGCGHVIWEKKEEGKCLEGVELYTIKMEMEEAEEAYNALAEYYRKNFNATVTEYKEDKYKHLNCSIYNDIIVTIFLTETPNNLQGDCEFAVMFARY